jgi:predicted component of type VI protein secretion system
MSELSLEIVEGPDAGRRASLSGPLEIGRGRDTGMMLADQLVSRLHARVSPVGAGRAVVEDLGSRNGTFVNGNQVHAPTELVPGDQLLLGVTVLELRTARQIAERPSAVRSVPPALAAPPRPPDYIPAALLDDPTPADPRRAAGQTLDPLLDVHAKGKARTAPLAVFVLVVLVVLVWLALGR